MTKPLDDALRTRSHLRVLRALKEVPAGLGVSGREAARRAGVSHPVATQTLFNLCEQGIVSVARSYRRDCFELNRSHTLVEKLLVLFEWEEQLGQEFREFIRDSIQGRTNLAESAVVFGSTVWGETRPRSDVDLVVTCERQHVEDMTLIMDDIGERFRERFGSHLSSMVVESSRFLSARSGVYPRIRAEGTWIIGSLGKTAVA